MPVETSSGRIVIPRHHTCSPFACVSQSLTLSPVPQQQCHQALLAGQRKGVPCNCAGQASMYMHADAHHNIGIVRVLQYILALRSQAEASNVQGKVEQQYSSVPAPHDLITNLRCCWHHKSVAAAAAAAAPVPVAAVLACL